MSQDELYMKRCFDIAQNGQGQVSPNPMVGCVIVHQNKIIGEGWHQKYGEAHAEVNAIKSISNLDVLPESTVYINLEPCSHFGKTPPCVDLLIKHKFKKVVISNTDPNPKVAGKGLAKLQEQGIETETGILEAEGAMLNRRFFTFFEKNRPYILLKWAETADGFIARENFDSKWISNEISRMWVHQWRSEEDAVLVGKNTAQYDNPQLNVRDWEGRNPIRLVIDPHRRLDSNLNLFDQSIPTLCYNFVENRQLHNLEFVKINPHHFLPSLLQDLYKREIQSILVEGGAQLLQSFIEANLWDEVRILKSQTTFGSGLSAPKFSGVLSQTRRVIDDQYFEYDNPNAIGLMI